MDQRAAAIAHREFMSSARRGARAPPCCLRPVDSCLQAPSEHCGKVQGHSSSLNVRNLTETTPRVWFTVNELHDPCVKWEVVGGQDSLIAERVMACSHRAAGKCQAVLDARGKGDTTQKQQDPS